MIINIVLLIGFLIYKVCNVHTNITKAPDRKDDTNDKAEPLLRFANIELLSKDDSLIQIYLYESANDRGVRVSLEKKDDAIKEIKRHAKTYVMFNGHPSHDSDEPYEELRKALFQEADANIISVYIDWTSHKISFKNALTLADSLGQHIGETLRAFGIQPNNCHLIAHCAGAEIGTIVSKHLNELYNYGKFSRLTVFDPFITNRTKLNYAFKYFEFVDVYHSGIYEPPFPPVGNIDFYPNAGMKQPGCENRNNLLEFSCHHRRSIYLYAESVKAKVNAIEVNFNTKNKNLLILDRPKSAPFGHMAEKSSFGAFYLPTYGTAPYLINYF